LFRFGKCGRSRGSPKPNYFMGKTLQVVRFLDRQRNVLVYMAYSARLIEGSPKNSISSVPIMNWPGTQTSAIPH
jgi:CreA protein